MKNRLFRARWALCLAGTLAFAGCGDDDTDPTPDGAVRTDGGPVDPCEGIAQCAAPSTACNGDTLVTCAATPNGCLVQTMTNCLASGATCEADGDLAVCQPDPCEAIPAAERCDVEGVSCDGSDLVDCAMNADGCLVATATDCAAMPGGACDDSTLVPMCVLPADPCADLPAEDRCETAGTSCTDDTLTTCAPDAFGCLVVTTEDCASRDGGVCDASGDAAVCAATDACADVTECAAAGTVCDGPELVTCAPDAFGCLVETRSDCTDAPFGFCDVDGATCSTAATDPCMGMTTCTEVGRSCAGDTLEVCAPNAFGCLVATPTDCTTGGDVCDTADGVAQCGPICSFRDTCPAAEYCAPTGELVSCTTDADGCYVEDTRADCGDALCGGDVCVGNCPGASPIVLDCASGTVAGDTAMGTAAIIAYAPCTTSTDYEGNEQVFLFRNATGANEVSITATRGASSEDFDLFALSGGDGTALCGAADTCLDSSRNVTATETVDFTAAAGELVYVVYDVYGAATETSDFTLEVSCTPVVCGDGVINGAEECDDSNAAAGDGCSDTCTFEPDFVCEGAPSTCRAVTCGDGFIDGAEECDDSNAMNGDGCSELCVVEDDALCEGEPSTCRVFACGDGFVDGAEECDDGDVVTGDGCSDACAIEMGYGCTGAPSTCVALDANAFCASATAITADTTITGEAITRGGPRPQGTGCGTSSGDRAHYYAVTLPARTQVSVVTSTTTSLDRVLLFQDSCEASACTYRTDSSPERGVLVNDTDAPVTRIVAVHEFGIATASGSYDVAFTYAPVPTFTAISAACVDTSAATALGVTADDTTSSIAALPFAFSYFGQSATHFTVSSNGFLQLFGSAAGSGSSAASNGSLPSTSTPNGVLAPFWDDLAPITDSNVYTQTTGTAGSRTFVAEWRNWKTFSGSNDLTFQVHVLEATGEVQFHYCAMSAGTDTTQRHTGSSATIGAENFAGTLGLSISRDTAGAVMTGSGFSLDL